MQIRRKTTIVDWPGLSVYYLTIRLLQQWRPLLARSKLTFIPYPQTGSTHEAALGFQLHQERSFYCRPAVVVLAWPQTKCVLRTRASALVVFRAPSPESQPAPRWGVLGRADAKNNRPEIEKQQWKACGMLLERN